MAVDQLASRETNGEARRHWAGQSAETVAAPRRQWEGGAAPGIDRYFRASRRRWRIRVGGLLLLTLLLTLAYLALLLHFPQRTPFVLAAAYDYAWPVAPNAWTSEDATEFRRLNGQIVELLDTSLAWKSRQHILSEWERTLKKIAARRSETNSAVFYLSLHGVVTEDGVPYLLPPRASPLEREQWVAVKELLTRLDEILPRDLHKLVVFDSTRQLDNWHAGVVQNTFALRLEELVAQLQLPNLAVLNATSAGEVAWSSADLRGSLFGRLVLLGLAGAADRSAVVEAGERDEALGAEGHRGGNGDGRVSVRELQRYVVREARRWSRGQRNATQTPLLLPAAAGDFTITWILHPRVLRKLEQELAAASRPADSVTNEELGSLWSSCEALRELDLPRVEPIRWHQLEHQLLWLEQLATSGSAYREQARTTHRELQEQLEKAVQRAATVRARPTLAGQLAVLSDDPPGWPRTLSLASLPLNEQLGILEPARAAVIEAELQGTAPSESTDALADDPALRDRVGRFNEVHFQRLTQQYHASSLWSDAQLPRAFLAVRGRLEERVARTDPRALPYLRTWLVAADRARRGAEDRLWAGEAAAGVDPVEELQQAYEKLAEGDDSPFQVVDRAWAVRDRALAEIPYWAIWLASTSPPGDDPLGERLPSLVHTAEQLGAALEEPPVENGQTLVEVNQLSRQLAAALDALRDEFLVNCAALTQATQPSAADLRSMEEALSIPLLPARQRADLRIAAARVARELHERELQPATTTGKTPPTSAAAPRPSPTEGDQESSEGSSDARADRVAGQAADDQGSSKAQEQLSRWQVHPVLTILWTPGELRELRREFTERPMVTADDLAERYERTGFHVRSWLREVAAASRGRVTPAATTGDGEAATDPSLRLRSGERNARLAAAIWLPVASEDAVRRRRQHDLQQMLLWYAERTLEDAYGSGPRDPLVPIPPPPYFERTTQEYLQAVALVAPLSAEAATTSQHLRDRLTARVRALQGWGSIRVRREAEGTSQDALTYLVTVAAPRADTEAAPGAEGAFPAGVATIWLRAAGGEPVGQRAMVPVPWERPESQVTLRAPLDGSGREGVLLFRGHEIPEAVDDLRPTGIVVDVRPAQPRQARVAVYGDRRQRSSVVFILDCSGSMSTEIAVETAGPSTLPRLELAKSALGSLLEQLAPRGEARVGVRFFGHRVGFSREKPVKVLRQEAYPEPIPEDLHPSDDVELFLPLGRFDSVEAGRVLQRLQVLQPWGQSPLYRALLQARGDFDREAEDTNKSIVVITDGENYQYAGNDPALRAPQAATARDVQAAFSGRSIPIFILGFGLSAESDAGAEREFTQLAESTGGEYFPVRNGRDLLRTLRTRLGVGTYSLIDDQGRPVAGAGNEPVNRLNLPMLVPNVGPQPRSYTVRCESAVAELRLEGGEAIVLQTSPDGRDLTAPPYDQGLPVLDTLTASGHKERLTVRAHRPLKSDRQVRFRVSLQDEELRFTPRPAEVWIEIKPVTEDDGEAPLYVFYDRHFTVGEPVPVIDCVASNWPASATRAEIRVWCQSSATPPAMAVPLSEVVRGADRFAAPQTVSGVDGFQFRASVGAVTSADQPWELRVVTQSAADGPDAGSLRVTWRSEAALLPVRIMHRYDPSGRQATHSFWFPIGTTPATVAQSQGEILFTARAATRSGAFRTANDRPLVVDVTGNDGTLQLDAATGTR